MDAGGLLVMGTSVNESRRIELQLRGRAGRQGDPGTTVMLYDIGDPHISVYGGAGALSCGVVRCGMVWCGVDLRGGARLLMLHGAWS